MVDDEDLESVGSRAMFECTGHNLDQKQVVQPNEKVRPTQLFSSIFGTNPHTVRRPLRLRALPPRAHAHGFRGLPIKTIQEGPFAFS